MRRRVLVRGRHDRIVGWRRAAGLAAVAGLVFAAAPASWGQTQTPPPIQQQVAINTALQPMATAPLSPLAPQGAAEPQARECRLDGWAFSVVSDGECLDLSGARGLGRDADSRPGQSDAGFGWRGKRAAVIFGYADPDDKWVPFDQSPAAASMLPKDDQGLFGMGLVMRWR